MSGSNFDGEIKDAMSPNSKMMPKKNAGAGKPSPNIGMKQSSNSTAKPPPSPQQYKPPQKQANGQQGLMQATDEPFNANMQQGGPSLPQQSGLHQAHAQIVSALAQKDMLKGH